MLLIYCLWLPIQSFYYLLKTIRNIIIIIIDVWILTCIFDLLSDSDRFDVLPNNAILKHRVVTKMQTNTEEINAAEQAVLSKLTEKDNS